MSKINSTPKSSDGSERTPLGRIVIWGLLALSLVIGIALYFVYARRVPSVL